MNRNVENYKKALDELKADNELKEKTLNNILSFSKSHGKNMASGIDNKFNNVEENNKENTFNKQNENSKRNIFKNLRVATYSLSTVFASVVIVFSVVLFSSNYDKISKPDIAIQEIDSSNEISKLEEDDVLPKVGSLDNLNKMLESMNIKLNEYNGATTEKLEMDSFLADLAPSTNKYNNYSKTNIQVEGVDEADIVKTDGNYIYYIANNKIYIVNVKNPQNMKIESTLGYEENIIPKELYINDNKLVAILDKSDINKNYNENSTICYDVISYDTETLIIIYDMRNKTDILEKRRIEVDGRYVDSRMINDEVYIVTTKMIYKTDEENMLPQYKDTFKDNEKHEVNVEEMLYVPETKNNSYLMIIGFSLNNDKEANIKTILGTGDDIYCTENNLYVTYVKYDEPIETYKNGIVEVSLANRKCYTNIFKFKLEDTNIISTAVGKVNGRTLNQFSMGEYNKNFAIVTTEDTWDGSSNRKIKNNLYILNENLEQIGVLENIAEDESLYAARFIGDKAFVVTFEQVDPLFVIDISNPTEPKILGELKIPGYSSYLHPYDETHIIGIGQDVEIEQTKYGERTVIKGVKVSLFDVSDYTNPKEIHSLIINDKSYTDASYDHKAILFSKEKNLLAFPMSSRIDDEVKQEYVILSIDLENGISVKNKINHGYEETEYGKYMVNIDRGLYINNNIFTLSNKKIVVSSGDGVFLLNIM